VIVIDLHISLLMMVIIPTWKNNKLNFVKKTSQKIEQILFLKIYTTEITDLMCIEKNIEKGKRIEDKVKYIQ